MCEESDQREERGERERERAEGKEVGKGHRLKERCINFIRYLYFCSVATHSSTHIHMLTT